MVRSSWIGALVGVLACAAAVIAQGTQAESMIMLRQGDGPPRACRVLKRWTDNKGNHLCQIQVQGSGETMIIADSEPPLQPTLLGTRRVTSWSSEPQPSPRPAANPPVTLTSHTPSTAEPPTLTAKGTAQPTAGGPFITVREAGKAQKCRVLKCWTDKDGSRICQVQAVDTGEMMTILEPGSAPAPGRRGLSRVFFWGSEAHPPQGTPPPPATAVVLGSPKPAEPSLWDRLFSSKSRVSTTAVVLAGDEKKTDKDGPKEKSACTACTEPAKPSEWRQSWGKVQRWVSSDTTAVKAEDVKKDEPKKEGLLQMARRQPEPARVVGPLPPPMPTVKVEDQTPSTWERLKARLAEPPAEPKPVTRVAKAPRRPAGPPPGFGPMAASMSPQLGAPWGMGMSVPASAPNAFTVMVPGQGGGMVPAMMPYSLPQSSPGEALANGFTAGGTSRPVPADMVPHPLMANAFRTNGAMGGAETRPMTPEAFARVMAQLPPGYGPPPMPMPAPMPSASGQLLATLRHAVLPSEREMAVEQLGHCDWRREPDVVSGLLHAAKADPAPAVRASCVRALGRMKVNTVPVVSAVQALEGDKDVRVRQEVKQALAVINAK